MVFFDSDDGYAAGLPAHEFELAKGLLRAAPWGRISRAMRLIDRLSRGAFRAGIGRRGTALLETVGRRSGQPRVTPVTNGLDGDTFWIVTEHGRRADYVRNLEAEPRVRVDAGRGWRPGIARITDEDPEARLDRIAAGNPRAKMNARIVRASATEMFVIRIDLQG